MAIALAITDDRAVSEGSSAGVTALVEAAVRRWRHQAPEWSLQAEPEPTSLALGAAGVAYFLYRHAGLGGGEVSLEAAERWIASAREACERRSGSRSQAGPVSSIPGSGLLYHDPGVWWVGALVAAAQGDAPEVRRSAGRLAEAVPVAGDGGWDVSVGAAGLLLGCATLVERLRDPAALGPLRAAGDQVARALCALAEREGALAGESALGYLGAAHGWAGIAQALLRWSQAVSAPAPPEALLLLERLIGLRRPSGRWAVRAGSREVFGGWCRGSAGWAQLWALAWQLTGEARLLDFAQRSAHDAVSAAEESSSLCCGRAGQGFAALTLYRTTGEQRWLTGAHRAAADAVRLGGDDGMAAHQLFHGELGIALLAVELEDPARAAMPAYESLT
ncbi:MAG: lanthionine synthetase LanC family protein [Solirubrobacteraceae bacterium]